MKFSVTITDDHPTGCECCGDRREAAQVQFVKSFIRDHNLDIGQIVKAVAGKSSQVLVERPVSNRFAQPVLERASRKMTRGYKRLLDRLPDEVEEIGNVDQP